MFFCCLSCVRLLPRFVFSESLPGRFARFLPNSSLGSGFESLCAENFLHKLLGMLNASLRLVLWGHAPHALALPSAIAQKSNASETHILWAFSSNRKNFPRNVAQSCCATCRALCALCSSRARWCRCGLERASWCKNTGFFYHAVVMPMQCSRSPRARTTSPLTHG